MSAGFRKKITRGLLVVFTLAVCWSASDSPACCGWTFKSVCAGSGGSRGAYCDLAFCYCGYKFNETDNSYTVRCANPGWNCQPPNHASYCDCEGTIKTDQIWTYVNTTTGQPCECVDDATRVCQTDQGCPGIQECKCGEWQECVQTSCCVPPEQSGGFF